MFESLSPGLFSLLSIKLPLAFFRSFTDLFLNLSIEDSYKMPWLPVSAAGCTGSCLYTVFNDFHWDSPVRERSHGPSPFQAFKEKRRPLDHLFLCIFPVIPQRMKTFILFSQYIQLPCGSLFNG
jgi:hypothetical protein